MHDSGIELESIRGGYLLSVGYLRADGTVESRMLRVLIPEGRSSQGFPLVFSVHYELPEGDPATVRYLARGWAVMTPVSIPPEAFSNIVGDDLRFQAAALQAARRLAFVDPDRIALRGGSAGGYQTLMLLAHQAGIRCGVSHSGVVNLSYQFAYLFANQVFNDDFASRNSIGSGPLEIERYPLPVVKQILDAFLPTALALGIEDIENGTWRLHSPVCNLSALDMPVLFTHSTADMVVPINPLMELLSGGKDEKGLPAGFRILLRELVSEPSLLTPVSERLSPERTCVSVQSVEGPQGPFEARFSPGHRYNLHIIDEGAVDRECGHYRHPENGVLYDDGFLAKHLGSTDPIEGPPSPEKLKVLAERFAGHHPIPSFRAFIPDAGGAFPGAIPGTLEADRLDVLLSLLSDWGIYTTESGRPSARIRLDRVRQTIEEHGGLVRSLRFLPTIEESECREAISQSVRNTIEAAADLALKCRDDRTACLLEGLGHGWI
jgi:hypothetical protein